MTLSPELELLRNQESDYEDSSETKQRVAHKTLVALIAATAVGKSTIIQRVVEQGGPDYSEAYSVVTRQRRQDDPAQYKTGSEGYTIERVVELIKQRAVTNYSIHPSSNIYASIPESFPAQYNLLPLMPTSLPMMRRAGFGAVHAVYIVTSVEEWAARLVDRQSDPSYHSRMDEAITSLNWAIAHADELSFIENHDNQLDQTASQLITLMQGETMENNQVDGLRLAHDMLQFAQSEQIRTS